MNPQPQTLIVRKDASGNIVPKFVYEQGDVRPNPAWFRAPIEERLIFGANAAAKCFVAAREDLHATCP